MKSTTLGLKYLSEHKWIKEDFKWKVNFKQKFLLRSFLVIHKSLLKLVTLLPNNYN